MPNLTIYLKALSTIGGFTGYLKKYKLREKKCTNTKKKPQQSVSTPIFIKLDVAQLPHRGQDLSINCPGAKTSKHTEIALTK